MHQRAMRSIQGELDPIADCDITVAMLCSYLTRCAGLAGDEPIEVEGGAAESQVEPDGYRVAEDLPDDPVAEVPQVPRPRPLGAEPLGELAARRLDHPPESAQPPRPSRIRVGLPGLVRGRGRSPLPGPTHPEPAGTSSHGPRPRPTRAAGRAGRPWPGR